VDEMVQQREEAREGILVCPGWIGDRDQVPCVNTITYRVDLKYRARTPPQGTARLKGLDTVAPVIYICLPRGGLAQLGERCLRKAIRGVSST